MSGNYFKNLRIEIEKMKKNIKKMIKKIFKMSNHSIEINFMIFLILIVKVIWWNFYSLRIFINYLIEIHFILLILFYSFRFAFSFLFLFNHFFTQILFFWLFCSTYYNYANTIYFQMWEFQFSNDNWRFWVSVTEFIIFHFQDQLH